MHTENGQPGIVVQASQQFGMDLWPVHRLDKVTSGILLLAKNQRTAARLSQLFAERKIDKFYLACSSLKPKKKQGWIKGDMAKSRNGNWKLLRSQNNPAITRFISHYQANLQQRLFLLKPETGRTHQLRVALKSLSSPINGDERYSGELHPTCRTYLHAYALQFVDEQQLIQLLCPPGSGHWGDIPSTWRSPWHCFR